MPAQPLYKSRILRFLIVGGVGTAFSFGLYAALLLLGVNYAVANLAALVAGILFSFKMQGRFVFGTRGFLWRFVLCWAAIYGANVVFIGRMMAKGMNGYVAGALTIPSAAVLSYLAQRFIVFRPADR